MLPASPFTYMFAENYGKGESLAWPKNFMWAQSLSYIAQKQPFSVAVEQLIASFS